MSREPNFFQNLQDELSDGRGWLDRSIVLAYAVAAGLCVVLFTFMTEHAFAWFNQVRGVHPWTVLLWTPAVTALAVWGTRRFTPGAAGSGIPQVMAALDPKLPRDMRHRFVSMKLTAGKMVFGSLSLLGGLSAGREGPSVQVAAGVMHSARRWLRPGSAMNDHALLVAGGAAGIAAAFNAPLAGVVFAIEELSNKLESRNNGLIISAIVLAGLVGISVFGNLTYFGTISVPDLHWSSFWPGLLVTLVSGALGGFFARLLAASLGGMPDRFSAFRRRAPIRFAACCGLGIAVLGMVSGGATFGAGAEEVRHMLEGESDVSRLYVLLKLLATWLTTWSGVPAGVFAPSLSIGAGIGHDVAQLLEGASLNPLAPSLIAIGMGSFLAAVTQAPLTSFIIVMEMINGRPLVLSLMASAMLASLISRMISRPLYATLSGMMINRLPRRGGVPPAPSRPARQPEEPGHVPESVDEKPTSAPAAATSRTDDETADMDPAGDPAAPASETPSPARQQQDLFEDGSSGPPPPGDPGHR